MQSFEKRLWKIIRDFALLARTDPAQLVLALRVVELQEKVDAQLKDSAAGVAPAWALSCVCAPCWSRLGGMWSGLMGTVGLLRACPCVWT